MRDLSALKERIDHAERLLEAAESERLNEGDALMKMWRQIRHRFVAQEQEIAEYQNRIEQLTQRNEELSGLVEKMLATIESGAARTRDENAAKIAEMAEELMTAEYPARDLDGLNGGAAPEEEPEDILELNDAAEDEPEPEFDDDDSRLELDEPPAQSQSPGIRGLVNRFEAAMQRSSRRRDRGQRPTLRAPSREDEDDDLQDDGSDHEIDKLRHELSGLRRRMTDAAGAP
jgi:hypothetical protein